MSRQDIKCITASHAPHARVISTANASLARMPSRSAVLFVEGLLADCEGFGAGAGDRRLRAGGAGDGLAHGFEPERPAQQFIQERDG